jgi:hypothetical protein
MVTGANHLDAESNAENAQRVLREAVKACQWARMQRQRWRALITDPKLIVQIHQEARPSSENTFYNGICDNVVFAIRLKETPLSLLVVGSVAFDAIESPYGKVDRIVGGAATYFAVAASFFTQVNLVGIVGDDFSAKDESIFHRRKIDIAGLERAPGKSFFWAGKYSQHLNERETLVTDLNVFANFNPKLPEKFRNSKHVFLANIVPGLAARRPQTSGRVSKARRSRHHELLD